MYSVSQNYHVYNDRLPEGPMPIKDCHPLLCVEEQFLAARQLCVSAVFAAVACLSVCPSVTLVDCINTAEDIVKLLVRPGNPITRVF